MTLQVLLMILCSLCCQSTYGQLSKLNPFAKKDSTGLKLPVPNEIRGQLNFVRQKASIQADNLQNVITPGLGYMRWFGRMPGNAVKYYFTYGLGIELALKGGKWPANAEGNNTNSPGYEHLFYAQVPLMVRLNYVLKRGGNLFAGAGLYYGILFKSFYEDVTGKYPKAIGNNPEIDYWRKGDLGVRLEAGYHFQHIPVMAGLTTDIGLRNILPGGVQGYNSSTSQAPEKITNHSVGFYIGYCF